MNLKKSLYLLLFGCHLGGAQNLIPNGSFESNTGCPNNYSQITLAAPWLNPSTIGSPDYYHQCGSFPVSTPGNGVGYQQPMQGLGYSGIYLYSTLSGSDLREYIEAPLTTTLQAGLCYQFKMYVSLGTNYKLSTDDIGAYFSPALISVGPNYNTLPYVPQVSSTQGVFLDTLNWTLVSGSFVASGNEQYVIIGNFKNNPNTSTVIANPGSSWNFAYAYVDSVSLEACKFTNVLETKAGDNAEVFLNSFEDRIHITCGLKACEVVVYNMLHEPILTAIANEKETLSTAGLPKGIYFCEVREQGQVITAKKLVKQ